MNNYVLDLGFVAFYNWWQVGIVLIFTVLYMIANIIPACAVMYYGVKERDFWYAPLEAMTMLIPFIGSLFGCHMMWEDNEFVSNFFVASIYGLIICMIGAVCAL